MPNATWPAGLPQQLLVKGYGETAPETTVRTAMDAGPDKVRNRFTAGVRLISGQVAMTAAQTETLDGFYVTTLQGGALPFDWEHPRTQASATLRIVKPPKYMPDGDGANWIATLDLEIMP